MAQSTYAKVKGIKINGSNKYAGGQIYNASINMSFNEKPIEITLNVVSKEGNYTIPKLDLSQQEKISIGELEFKDMVPFKTKTSYSTTNGKVLEISFIDSTFVLDKLWVGIPGKHGIFKHEKEYREKLNKDFYEKNKGYMDIIEKNQFVDNEKNPIAEMLLNEKNETSSIFLIGRYFHPCDFDKDNKISPKEDKNLDPCDPCPYCPEDKYESKCFELGQTKLYDAGYSFKDLVDQWKLIKFPNSKTIEIEAPKLDSEDDPKPYEKYYRDYHGPLREVLTSWASDFGLTWYYDMTEQKIKFLDFNSKEINVDSKQILADYTSDKLISYELEKTAENTTQIASISWYEREGEKKNFDCSQSQAIALSPLFAADLIGNKLRNAKVANGNGQFDCEDDLIGAMYGSYYQPLRDVYWLRTKYGITDADSAAKLITTLNLDTGFEDDGRPKQENAIPEMGDMVILGVAGRYLSSQGNGTPFQKIFCSKLNDLENTLTDSERSIYRANSGFFIIAYQNQEYYERTLELERQLFNFVGRFHIRENLMRLCSITGTEEFVRNNTSIEAPDGSAQIYSKREGMDSSPLAQFKILKKGYLNCILTQKNVFDKQTFFTDIYKENGALNNTRIQGVQYSLFQSKDYKEGLYNKDLEKNISYINNSSPQVGKKSNSIPLKMGQSVIILDRQAQWIPKPDDFENYRRALINSNFSLLTLKELGNDGQIPYGDWTKAAFGQEAKDQGGAIKSGFLPKIKIFLTYPGKFEVEIERNQAHPTDRDIYQKKDYEIISRRIGGRNGSLAKLGLLSSKCAIIRTKINGNEKIFPKIYTPPLTLTKQKSVGKKIINDDDEPEENKPCDNFLSKSYETDNRQASYKVLLSQNFNQSIVLPKIQTGVHSGIKAPDEVMRFNINYKSVSNDEFIAFTGYTGYGCIPNLKYLKKINDAYSKYAISNLTLDDSLKFEIKSLPKFKSYTEELKKGLDSINLSLSEQGVTCSLSYSTKAARKISDDIAKWKNTIRYNSQAKGQ